MQRRIKSKERSASLHRHRVNGVEIPKGKFPPVSDDDVALVAQVYPSFHECLAILSTARKEPEKRLAKLAAQLPVSEWAKSVRGFGVLSLAAVVGEAGDVTKYGNPGKLWKRLGLAVIEGKSQRKATDPEQAAKQGYNPNRRAQMHVIGENLIRAGNEEYRKIYDEQKAKKIELGWTKGHAHKHALRYIEKRLLRELWKAWRANLALSPTSSMPAEYRMAAE